MSRILRICHRALATCILSSFACNDPTHPIAHTELLLAAPAFARAEQGGAEVRYTVANRSATTVHITTRCGDQLSPAIEQRSGNGWRTYSGGTCVTINAMTPVPLLANTQRDGVVEIVEAGEYRLILGTDRGSLTSSAFTIE
ncbi:hypothetical protein [Gemmatimonas sp.]|uniref:hypothetical protein n=1 Tax=Gemmatimonas sp. TaxID=1962908 RepID=UPI00286C485E|nr:hypothetical protein [Gemmatimonas sp.]